MPKRRGAVRIGLSGWTYAPWRGNFYPEGLTQKRELSYAAGQFNALEINGTFYGLQRPETFARWAEETPKDFVFAVKGSRFITHVKRLSDIEAPLANFLASGLLELGAKLGVLLWQLPPNFAFDAETIGAFLETLPKDMDAAAAFAARHNRRVDGRASVAAKVSGPLRHALEIRHDSFRDPAFIDLLTAHGVALVCADTVKWPRLMDLTADSPIAGCTAQRSSIARATRMRRSSNGPAASMPGPRGGRCATANSWGRKRRRRDRATCSSSSTIPTSCTLRTTRGGSRRWSGRAGRSATQRPDGRLLHGSFAMAAREGCRGAIGSSRRHDGLSPSTPLRPSSCPLPRPPPRPSRRSP